MWEWLTLVICSMAMQHCWRSSVLGNRSSQGSLSVGIGIRYILHFNFISFYCAGHICVLRLWEQDFFSFSLSLYHSLTHNITFLYFFVCYTPSPHPVTSNETPFYMSVWGDDLQFFVYGCVLSNWRLIRHYFYFFSVYPYFFIFLPFSQLFDEKKYISRALQEVLCPRISEWRYALWTKAKRD